MNMLLFQFSGTPPRIDKNTIDYSQTEVQPADTDPIPFSFMNDRVWIDVRNILIFFIFFEKKKHQVHHTYLLNNLVYYFVLLLI